MISFMVLGGPRSATTWAANWLTTDTTLCLHDPLLEYTIEQLGRLEAPGKRLGISCTSSLLYPEWVNASPAKKLILYRDINEINNSLRRLGLVPLDEVRHLTRINMIRGAILCPYQELFSPRSARTIANHLGVPFDVGRHSLLRQMRIEPMWRHLDIGAQAARDLVAKITEELNK